MKSLTQLKKDKRIYDIEVLAPGEAMGDIKYFVWLADGWYYEDDSGMFSADTVKEINEELKLVRNWSR